MLQERLTLKEVARELGRSLEQVRRYVREGKLPAHKLGMQWFVDRSDLDAFRGTSRRRNLEVLDRISELREKIRRRWEAEGILDQMDSAEELEKLREERCRELSA